MLSNISFVLDGRIIEVDFNKVKRLTPTTTVLNYLRRLPDHKGTKEGCAEGDCGACTVVIGELSSKNTILYKAVDSCLIFLPMIHGKQLITVENLRAPSGELHPVQRMMVEKYGSQCGYCTPGIIMSMFALYKNNKNPLREEIDDALIGNLCRCTGYKTIAEAAKQSCNRGGIDHFTDDEPRIINMLRSISNEPIHIQTDGQRYFRPASLGEAVSLKHQHSEAILINGATDIALRVTKGHESLKEIIDLTGIAELKEIKEAESSISIGSGVLINDVMSKARNEFPALFNMLCLFGSNQIRNLATFGGNIGTASPIGDAIPVLMAYNAAIDLEGLNGRRLIPVNEYFLGYRRTLRKPEEIITAIIIPKPAKDSLVRSYKISKRRDLDISTVSAGFRIDLEGGKVKSVVLAYGGMAERTKRAAAAERYLSGKLWERRNIEQAMSLIDKDFTPISDVRGSAEFRMLAAKNLLLKFWNDTKC